MKTILHNELYDYGAFTQKLPSIIERLINVNNFNIPYRMKALIAMSELISFTSQFKRNILLPDDALVPINSISFCIAPSGGNKDSSLRITRKVFSKAYDLLESTRRSHAISQAIEAATAAGEASADSKEVYTSYLVEPVATFLKDVTPQGLIQYMNDIAVEPLGAGVMVNSEIADEFNTNPNFPDIIKVLSEAYDLGILEASYTKGKEYRNNGISGVPFNALFIGSYYMLMYNQQLKTKFIASFMSKLSRRCSFTYAPDKIEDPVYSSGAELIAAEQLVRAKSKAAAEALIPEILRITQFNIQHAGQPLRLSPEADTIMLLLKRYDTEVANTECAIESADSLYRKNRYWRALKLAGALAIMDSDSTIQAKHFTEAINLTELFSLDMAAFEHDLSKSDHERFSDFIRTQVLLDNRAIISVHDLKKQGFVSTATKAKLQELVMLCTAYDTSGIYSVINEGAAIQYEPIIKTERLNISYKPLNMTALNNAIKANDPQAVKEAKHHLAMSATYGFELGQTTFSDLANLLSGDYAYSPFTFRNGIRGKDNIIGGTKWLVYDLDNSTISAAEAHFMLSDLNHHIALSSDPSNDYKFRVLIELDSVVDLDPITWKHFYTSVADHLALKIDVLPQSQIFFSYAGRPILSVIDASPLNVRQFIIDAKEKRTATAPRPLTTAQQRALLNDPLETFKYCWEAKAGEGSRAMIRMVYHMKDLGASLEEVLTALHDVQEYWENPMDENRFNNTIIRQAQRIYGL